jgi:hypothetical protein
MPDSRLLPGLSEGHLEALRRYLAADGGLGILVLDEALRVVWANGAFRRLLGSGSAGGSRLESLVPDETVEAVRQLERGEMARMSSPFSGEGDSGAVLHCLAYAVGGGYLLAAEHMALASNEVAEQMTVLNNELANTARQLRRRQRELQEAYDRIRKLSGMLPICSHCKKIRDDDGYWNQVETYVSDHSDASFSHGLCPECARELYPGVFDDGRDGE